MIRAMVVDDERPSLDKMAKLLQDSGSVEIVGRFTDPAAALEFLRRARVDVAFLDIEMPDMDGIELSNRVIDLQRQTAIIFVTAYNQYAVEAFRLNALDYLMKPVTAERLRATLERIKARVVTVTPNGARVRCFGKLVVGTEANEVRFRTRKAEELFALLIDQRGGFISRNRIIDCLWDDYDGDRALVHFNTTLHYVKRALAQQGVELPIVHDRGSYRIETSALDCDYLTFYAIATNNGGVDGVSWGECEAAMGLYAGDYLRDSDYPWAEGSRQLLKDMYMRLLLRLVEHCRAGGRQEQAVGWLMTGLSHEPLHRELNYRLIEALMGNHDRLAAERYYELYRNGLRNKLQQEPDSLFRKLLQRR